MFVTPGYAHEASPALDQSTAVEGAEHGKGAFPPFDPSHYPSQILWLAIIFGLFYLFLKQVAVPRVGSILDVRRERIAHDLDQAAKMKEEADAAVAAYEQELAEARAKANSIGQDARNSAKVEAEAKRKQVEGELEKKLADAEAHIAGIKSSALAEVSSIATDTASVIVERLVGLKVDKATVAAAVKSVRE
ncbi:F0F1 ATP synthase subunit B [Mesorhizobium sp. BAC0120]|uniref:F0F1 ATP synthase subunit B n=1 Tax=Mesorhizobium sp. BAC0120 TaxID=3090670 RepID=UPI00298D0B74|nr:F0F1 ATP synthase subunit B [Mesorhizobium sp. BAC0120]MDW6020836.1 F0F1 ATP synthase subunit B [Mesorhizobium sp. BAC0120]